MGNPPNMRWISISEALYKAMANPILDMFSSCDAIEAGLATGKIRARAAKVRINGQELEPASSGKKVGGKQGEETYFEVAAELLEGGEFSPDFLDNPQSVRTVHFQSHAQVVALTGLQIHLKSFDKYMRNALVWNVSGVMKGRPRSEQAWLLFILSLVELERDGQLTEDRFPTADALKKTLASEMEFSGEHNTELDVRTYGTYVDAIWDVMIRNYHPTAQ